METTEIKIARMEEKIKNVDSKVDSIVEMLKEHVASQERQFEMLGIAMEEKYAPKIAWDIIRWAWAIMGGSLLLYAIETIFLNK